jgi:hypothetical protein
LWYYLLAATTRHIIGVTEMDTRIEVLANVIFERCQQMTDDIDVSLLDEDSNDRHRTYLHIKQTAIEIKGHLDLYRDRHPELY